jgi:transposase-like protein
VAKKKKARGQKYTDAEKSRIMRTAIREGLTGEDVKHRFGVTPVTFYRWRKQSLNSSITDAAELNLDESRIRDAIRKRLEKILPRVVHEEVEAYLGRAFGIGSGTKRGT